jgi:predicted nucleic acid-binding protein
MGAVVLDAGVLIALSAADDAHHKVAVSAVRQARDAGRDFLLPASAYSESLVAPLRHSEEAAGLMEEFVDELPARLVTVDRRIGRTAAELRARHGRALKLPDALVVATAAVEGAEVFTTDAGWPRLDVPVTVLGA